MDTTQLRFKREDVRPAGWVPGTTALSYAIFDGDRHIGQVNYLGAVAKINAGEDIEQWIADTLNDHLERGLSEADLRKALDDVLSV